MAKTHLRG